MAARRVKCPTCGRAIEWSAASPWRPFCSERCRLLDLGGWLTERHAIPGEELPTDDREESGRDAPERNTAPPLRERR